MIRIFAKSFGGIIFYQKNIFLTKEFCANVLSLIDTFFNEIFKTGYFEFEKKIIKKIYNKRLNSTA